ncbi:MAG: hypothetical protein HY791_25000 [Deltaproteobacteria bacterium]|nr:hypothetical protein [Deltaproteobacteria bacterium]
MSVRSILPGVHTFAKFSEEKQLDFNGWHVAVGGTFVLIDPPEASDEDVEVLRSLGAPTKILITNKDHRRAAPHFRDTFGAPIAVSGLDRELMDCSVDETFNSGDRLFGELEVIGIPWSKSPGESALFWRRRRVLFLGDALIGKPAGSLSLLPPVKFKEPDKAPMGLEPLRKLEVDAVLVGDGVSVLEGGSAAIAAFLAHARA